jgi:hypothetical protein
MRKSDRLLGRNGPGDRTVPWLQRHRSLGARHLAAVLPVHLVSYARQVELIRATAESRARQRTPRLSYGRAGVKGETRPYKRKIVWAGAPPAQTQKDLP